MSEQGLTERDFRILGAAFEPSEIGSNGGKPYVKARAIKKRLRLIDPNYTTDIDTYIQVIGDVVTVWGGLTIKGVRHAASKSKNVNCWRKVQVDDNDASKGQKYVRVDEYEYARELSYAIMKAQSGLLQRAAETFDVGDYLKEKSSPHPPSLATVLTDPRKPEPPQPSGQQPTTTPPATPGAPTILPPPESGEKDTKPLTAAEVEAIKSRAKQLDLAWESDLKRQIEQGKVLEKLSDSSLSYSAIYHRMDEIKAAKVAAELEAKRAAQPASQKGDEPISIKCADLQANDLVYGLSGRLGKPSRLMHYLGDTADGVFAEWVVWSQTQYTNVTRLPFDKSLNFRIVRRDAAELVTPPDGVLTAVAALIDSYKTFNGKESESV